MTDFDRRLGDWLEDGPQTIPSWLVEQAVSEARATRQLGAGFRWRWIRPPQGAPIGRHVSAAAGGVTALAVLGAFVLGVVLGPQFGDEPSPTPHPSEDLPTRPPVAVSQLLGGLETIEVLPGESPDFFALTGLAATSDAAWIAVVTGDSARLVRIDAATTKAEPVAIPGAGSMLSPPALGDGVAWTGSTAGLHRVDLALQGEPVTLPLDFVPAEIAASSEGLWVSRPGGTALVDPATGATLREIETGRESGRIIGAPVSGSLWACLDPLTLARVDPESGGVSGALEVPPDGDCQGPVFETAGVAGVEAGLIPYLTSVVVDPASLTVSSSLGVGAWSDVVRIGTDLWFLQVVRDRPGSNLALVQIDPVTRGPARTLTFPGSLHTTAAFESGYLAVAGDYLWVLADPGEGAIADGRPQIIRISLAELRAP